jgi:hypothetical protein
MMNIKKAVGYIILLLLAILFIWMNCLVYGGKEFIIAAVITVIMCYLFVLGMRLIENK